jgi:hypothetical protein
MGRADHKQAVPPSTALSPHEEGVFTLVMVLVPVTFIGILAIILATAG